MPLNPEEDKAKTRQHVTDIAVSLGVALLDTFRGPCETTEDRIMIIDRWRDVGNSICNFDEYVND